MKTRFNQRAYRVVASAVLLMALAGCGSSVVPLSNSGALNSGGGAGQTNTYGNIVPLPTPVATTGPTVIPPIVTAVSTPWNSARIAEGDVHSCLLDTGGGVWCWGHNSSGQLGNGTTTDGKYVEKTSYLTSGTRMIAAGGYHTCALDAGGGVWCWGANDSGQLGNGGTAASLVPVRVSGLSSGIVALALGYAHTCAIDIRGIVWCWGDNTYGQLGNGTTSNSSVPLPTLTSFTGGAVSLALGYHHSCATNAIGALYCWGFNDSGRLGDGTTTNRSVPTQVAGLTSGIQSVSAGYVHTCAVDSSGTLWCWGSNFYGQLGTGDATAGTNTAVLTPLAVTGLSIGVQTLSLGGYHSCVTDGSSVSCWGDNKYGQVGLSNSYLTLDTPNIVGGVSSPIRGLALGGYHSCALDAVGLQCWGNNFYDQLGDGTYVDNSNPVQVYSVSPPH